MATRTVKATCLCGSAAHEITLQASEFPLPAYICTCDSCRRMTGTLAHTAMALPKSYKPAQELLDKLTYFQFSKLLTQYHCPTCGSQMFAHSKAYDEGAYWMAATGTLEKFDGVAEVQCYDFVADTLDGGFADLMPTLNGQPVKRWAHERGKGEELPIYWHAPENNTPKPSSTDRLHAHCKCGGVQFWINKASEGETEANAAWPDVLIPFNAEIRNKPLDPGHWWLRENGTKYLVGSCTCNSCRLAAGMEVVQWAYIPVLNIALDAEGKVPFSREIGTLKHYRSSDSATRHFCGKCGASVFWDGDDRPMVIDVAVGLLDAPEGSRAKNWLDGWSARLSYREDAIGRADSIVLGLEDGMKKLGEHVGKEK